MAKVGLEVMAQHHLCTHSGFDDLVDDVKLDPVRFHAREGRIPNWPFNTRTIHDPNSKGFDESGQSFEVFLEYDIFKTDLNECYLVLVILGIERALNLYSPEIAGYLRWAKEHEGVSPLSGERTRVSLIGPHRGLVKEKSPIPDVSGSSPHPTADPERAFQLNIQFQKDMAAWKALSFLRRITTKKPNPPTGI